MLDQVFVPSFFNFKIDRFLFFVLQNNRNIRPISHKHNKKKKKIKKLVLKKEITIKMYRVIQRFQLNKISSSRISSSPSSSLSFLRFYSNPLESENGTPQQYHAEKSPIIANLWG